MTCTHYNFPVPEEKMVRVITDTDLCNEADDPFAVVQALLSPKFDNVGVVAAHFGTRDPNGMQKSWQGLKDLTVLMQLTVPVLHGAPHALPDAATPVPSEGAKLIIREAMKNVVFGSTMPVWQVPKNVYEMMPVSMAELEYRVRPQGAVGRYLFDQLVAYSQTPESRTSAFRTGESWVLGDNPAPGLLLYEHRFQFDWVPAPYVTADQTYAAIGRNRPIRVYKGIDSRLILDDLYAKLALFAQYMAQKGE